MENDIAGLIKEIGQVRKDMMEIVERIDPQRVIYPGWSIKEMIGHITAWEVVIEKTLALYINGDPPYFLREQDFDIFNQEAVDHRSAWSLEQVIQEWKKIRAGLIKTIQMLKEEDLQVEIVLPWGSERTVAELIEIAGEHESEHKEDALRMTD